MDDCLIRTDYADFSWKSSVEIFTEYQLHCHSFFELYYFISGNVRYMVEGKKYEPAPDSMLLLRPNAVHGVMNTSEALYGRYAFHFRPEMIPAQHRELLFSPFSGDPIYFEKVGLAPFFNSVLAAATMPVKIREIALTCRFEALLTELYHLAAKAESPTEVSSALAVKITAYIGEHIQDELSLENIARAFFISKSHLNRLFRRDLDTTVSNYIGLKRASIARELLLQGESATCAALAAGFRDYSTFFRAYKKFIGRAPTAEAAVLGGGQSSR